MNACNLGGQDTDLRLALRNLASHHTYPPAPTICMASETTIYKGWMTVSPSVGIPLKQDGGPNAVVAITNVYV